MKQKTYRYHSLGFLCLLLSPWGIQAESPPHPPASKEQTAQTTSQLPATSSEVVHQNQAKPEPESSVSKQPHEEEMKSKTPSHPQVSETLSSKEPLNQGNPKAPESPPSQPFKEDNNKAELDKLLGEMKPILAETQKVEAYLVGPELADTNVPEQSKFSSDYAPA